MKYKIPHRLLDVIMAEARSKGVSPFALIENVLTKHFLLNKESTIDHTATTNSR